MPSGLALLFCPDRCSWRTSAEFSPVAPESAELPFAPEAASLSLEALPAGPELPPLPAVASAEVSPREVVSPVEPVAPSRAAGNARQPRTAI